MLLRKTVAFFVIICLVFACGTIAFAEEPTQYSSGISIDFSSATDEELEQAIRAIRAEQRKRLKTRIVMSETELVLAKGSSARLTATIEDVPDDLQASSFSWSCPNSEVASCNNGYIVANAPGTTTIYCTSTLSDGTVVDAECTVTVVVLVSSITVPQKQITVYIDQSAFQPVTVLPENASDFTYTITSSDPSVVKVINKIPTAVGVGTTTITVTANDGSGKTASYQVNVPNLDIPKITSGSVLTFGSFEQDNNLKNGNEKIRWIVLERDDNRVLLLSQQILDVRQFHAAESGAFWANSDLRTWLNGEFLRTSFSFEEQNAIILTSNLTSNGNNGEWTESYSSEKIFILSGREAREFFDDYDSYGHFNPIYRASATNYAMARQKEGAKAMGIKNEQPFKANEIRWWMRGGNRQIAFGRNTVLGIVSSYAYTYFLTAEVTTDYYLAGVRPAIWVDLSKADLLIDIISFGK